jgi:pimeloyl-ACP methyl ester carboxylesterase
MDIREETPLMEYTASGRGEPLVMVPGGLTGWLSWAPHAEILAESRRVYRLQLLNVALGLSGTPLPDDYSVNYEVAALGRTVDKLGLEQADYVAWSYGGEISLSYAIHNPHRIRSLTLIEPPAFWVLHDRDPLPEEIVEQQHLMQTFSRGDVSAGQLVGFLHHAGLVPEEVDPRTLSQWPLWFEHRQSLRMKDTAQQHRDSRDLLRAFDKPVLLVRGEEPGPNPHLYVIDVLAEELPNARVARFPGRHGVPVVSKEAFLERLTRFLSSPERD